MSSLIALIVVVIFLREIIGSDYNHLIYIDSQHGSNTEGCLLYNNASVSCRDFDWVLKQPLSRRNSTHFVLATGKHKVKDNFVQFNGVSQLKFSGTGSTLNCVQPGIGLSFINSQDISFCDLKIFNCSFQHNLTTRRTYFVDDANRMNQIYVAVYFSMCQNVVMENVEIEATPRGTALFMSNVMGLSRITNSVFENNNVENYPGGGGGVIVEFTTWYSSCLNSNCFNLGSYTIFENLTFFNNCAGNSTFSSNNDNFISKNNLQSIFGKGGGFAIFFMDDTSNKHVVLSNCIFGDNKGIRGSAVLVEFHDHASNNTVELEDCTFKHNGFAHPQQLHTAGGGVMVGHYVHYESDMAFNHLRNSFAVINCKFTGNIAYHGGAMCVIPAKTSIAGDKEAIPITIKNSHFVSNIAHLGAAIEAVSFPLFTEGQTSTVLIESASFINNSIYMDNFQIYEEGVGTVYSNAVPIRFKGNILYEGNRGSALAVVGNEVSFIDCNASFIGNRGRYGGGINILGSAYLLVNDETSLTFISNQARIHGGAISNIYTERENFKSNPNCFIRNSDPFTGPDNWKARFLFMDNNAVSLGQSIYTTSLLPCTWVGGSKGQRIENIFHWKGWTYKRNEALPKNTGEIATAAGKVHYHKEGAISGNILQIKATPGTKILLPIRMEDDLQQSGVSKSTTFMARFIRNDTQTVKSHHKFLTGDQKIPILGNERNIVRVALDSLGQRSWHVEFDVLLKECPPGYYARSFSCSCLNEQWGAIIQCLNKFQAGIQNGYWTGKDEKGKVVASICPPSYCNMNESGRLYYMLTSKYHQLNDHMCGGSKHRKGILCSSCQETFGVSVTTNNLVCIPCSNGQIASNIVKYILVVYFPIALLFFLFLIFHISFSGGAMNSFILYAQIVSSGLVVPSDPYVYFDSYIRNKPKFTKLYEIIYGIFNLRIVENMIHPLCIHPSLNALDVFQLNYLTALFPVVIYFGAFLLMRIGSIPKVKKHCGRCKQKNCLFVYFEKKCCSDNLLKVFSAFLVLSYTKLTLSSFLTLRSVNRMGLNARVFYAGEYQTTDNSYIWRYKLVACLILSIGLLLVVILLQYPIIWIEKVVNRIKWLYKLYPRDKIHTFLASFQQCYRDERKYFAGLYLLFRIALGAAGIGSRDSFSQYINQQFLLIFMILLVGILHPYRKEFGYLNSIDFLMLTNLAAVNGISLYKLSFNVFYNSDWLRNFNRMLYIQYTLLYLPIVGILIYLVKKLFTTMLCSKVTNNLRGRQEAADNMEEDRDREDDPFLTSIPSISDYGSSASVDTYQGYRHNYRFPKQINIHSRSQAEGGNISSRNASDTSKPDNDEKKDLSQEMSSLAKESSLPSNTPT